MNELPNNWATARLGDLAEDISYGYTAPSTRERIGPHLLRITDIQENDVLWSSVPYCEIDAELANKYLLKENDLLFARTGATVGKSFLIKGEIPDAVFASYLIRVRCMRPEAAGYLSLYFRSQDYWRQITEFSAGIGQPNVNGSKLKELIVPLPPLAEQTRIAAKLDELLAQVDTLKARIDGIPALLKRFRQSVLAAAVSGRLTEAWRDVQLNGEAPCDSSALPAGWSAIPLGRYAINHDGARKPISAKEREARKGDHPYFGATGQIDRIDGYTHDGEFVLVGEDGANLLTRIKPIAFIAKGKIWVNNHAHVIASPSGHSNSYLAIYLNTLNITPWVTGSAQPKLNQKKMNEISVHVPPPAEQTEIVRRVEQLFAFADQLEARVKAAQARIDRLTQSILAKAFRGELVPQDPNDEPASVLLERIKAQRAAAPKAKRGRRAAMPS